jgi:hypothetical protein
MLYNNISKPQHDPTIGCGDIAIDGVALQLR